ncbi:PstS family phosphate ABC transporter substrate-binding protein [Halocatena halophila]|uniref:PstS family phosphate ABC transporter substrate-binding protein n=1 Tax=Halocatena halophila TaxID=2814576 RepID=UPI002ED11CE1
MPAERLHGYGVTRRQFVATTGVAGVGALAGCTANPKLKEPGDGSDGPGKLSGNVDIAGSSTVYPLSEAVSIQFNSEHPDVDVSLSSTGTGGGFKNFFSQGKTDFNNASRPIKQEERTQCENNGVTPLELRIATDALTVIVNTDADWVECVTVAELKQIWEPNGATHWSDVRPEWPNEPIKRYGAADTSGTFDYFTDVIVGEEGSQTDDYSATEKDNIIVQGVEGNKYAIGYMGFAYYQSSKDRIKALAIDDGDGCVKPSIETAKDGSYTPLSRPLFTYVAKESLSESQVAAFARFFVEQSTNQGVVTDQVGYVPNSETTKNEMLEKLNSAMESTGP